MYAYFSKSEDSVSEAMKQAAKEAFNSNKSNMEQMRSIPTAYNTNRECSIQEAVYFVKPFLVLFLQISICRKIALEFAVARRKLVNYLKIILIFLNEI